MSELLFTAVALALTGTALSGSASTPDGIVAELDAMGWDSTRIAAVRAAAQDAGHPWPHPVADDQLTAAGPARVLATVRACRSLLGQAGLRPAVRHPASRLDAADRRLLAEVPPHHGPVG